MKTIMITAPTSNSGKTVITLGIIRALKNRGIDVSAFKTGPDFIDRKYISLASNKIAGNLDMHLMGKEGIWDSLNMNPGDFAVIEGAMGYFDGIFNTYENSSYDISRQLDISAILVYTPKGEMFSAIPKIKGMVDFSKGRIQGVILNKTSESQYGLLKAKIEEYINISVLGFLPKDDSLKIESRYLGLFQPEENVELEQLIDQASIMVERTIDIDKVIKLSKDITLQTLEYPKKKNINVAIAYDDVFNFYYEENLALLKDTCNVQFFSPLNDKKLPKADLIYIGGGYPELYAERLSSDLSMIESIKSYVENDGYLYAEAGGLMYLVDSIEEHTMCGILGGRATMTDKLQRFGYVNLELTQDTILGQAGDKLTGQEFHKSIIQTSEEEVLSITKPMTNRNWKCGYGYKNALGMYQHINFVGNMKAFNYLLQTIENSKGGF